MERAGEILARAMRRIPRREAPLAWLTGAWPSIVGPRLAAHTRPVSCSGGSLEIMVGGKDWGRELSDMKSEFCRRINQSWGGVLVCEVRFVAAKASAGRIRHEIDNDHTPFVRRKSKRR